MYQIHKGFSFSIILRFLHFNVLMCEHLLLFLRSVHMPHKIPIVCCSCSRDELLLFCQ